MTTHTGRQFTHTFGQRFRVYWPGRAVAIPGLDLNIMTEDNAGDNETQRAAAVSELPSSPIMASGSSKFGRTRAGVSRRAVDNSRSGGEHSDGEGGPNL